MPGRRMSSKMQSISPGTLEASSVSAEAKVTNRYPDDRSRLLIPSQTAASSSTTAIRGAPRALTLLWISESFSHGISYLRMMRGDQLGRYNYTSPAAPDPCLRPDLACIEAHLCH